MNYCIIGTAGHVDHGKTSLIQALTGIETDRLAEEKRRGITIDLGFAHLLLGEVQAGIIDVPGHERFLKNMLAGAGQINLALMVVAADEGVMPQTSEHLAVLSLLGVTRGVVALTKADLVDTDGLDLARQELAQQFRGSFLQDAPVVAVSAKTGLGLGVLHAALEGLALTLPAGDTTAPFRLHVDRVFVSSGFGVVAAGVVAQGKVCVDDLLCLSPGGQSARVRGIQVYGVAMREAVAGQRAALNLARVKSAEISRGCVLAPEPCAPAVLLDVRLEVLLNGTPIQNNQRVHLFAGTAAALCRVVLLGQDTLEAGVCYAQLRLESPLAVQGGDRFVLRFYSPLSTVGGGIVLRVSNRRHRRSDTDLRDTLQILDKGTPREQLLLALGGGTSTTAQARALLWQTTRAVFDTALQALLEEQTLLPLAGGYAIAADMVTALQARAVQMLTAYHKANPLAAGIPRAQLKEALFGRSQQLSADAIISLLAAKGTFEERGGLLALPLFYSEPPPEVQAAAERLSAFYRTQGFVPAPPQKASIAGKAAESALRLLCGNGELIRIAPDAYLDAAHYARAVELLRRYIVAHSSITLAQYRDLLYISRKPAQQLLEHFDAAGITRKTGDERVFRQPTT